VMPANSPNAFLRWSRGTTRSLIRESESTQLGRLRQNGVRACQHDRPHIVPLPHLAQQIDEANGGVPVDGVRRSGRFKVRWRRRRSGRRAFSLVMSGIVREIGSQVRAKTWPRTGDTKPLPLVLRLS
jgi:hypothetical protein